jgi:hypothetical protein
LHAWIGRLRRGLLVVSAGRKKRIAKRPAACAGVSTGTVMAMVSDGLAVSTGAVMEIFACDRFAPEM